MKRILELITQPEDAWVQAIVEAESHLPGCQVEKVELKASGQDYEELLEKIFAADVVHVW